MQRNLDAVLISKDELMTQLRVQGVDDLAQVQQAALEGNGEVSVIRKEQGGEVKGRSEDESGAA